MVIQVGDTMKETVERLLPLQVSLPCKGVCLIQVSGEVDILPQPRLKSCVRSVLRSRPVTFSWT